MADFAALEAEDEVEAVASTQQAVVRALGMRPLVQVLERGSMQSSQPAAARAVDAVVHSCPFAIAAAMTEGAVVPLVKMLSQGTPYGKAAAASALCSLSEDPEVCAAVIRAGAVKNLVLLMACGDLAGKLQSVRTLLRLTVSNPGAVSDAGAVPVLILEVQNGMASGTPQGVAANGALMLRKELAVCALLLLARKIQDHQAQALLGKSGIPALAKIAGDKEVTEDARSSAIAALWRLIDGSPHHALTMARNKGLLAIQLNLRSPVLKTKVAACLCVGEIAVACDIKDMEELAPMVLNLLSEAAGSEGVAEAALTIQRADQAEAGREAAAGALHVLIEQNADNASRAVGAGALLELAELMGKGGTAASRIEAATAVHSIAYIGGPATRLKAVQAGVLHPVLEMVEQSGASDAIMLLANTPGERKRVQALAPPISAMPVWDSEAAQADVLEAYKVLQARGWAPGCCGAGGRRPAPMVLNLLSEAAGSEGVAEAALTIQRAVSRGTKASDPRVQIHVRGQCSTTASCDVCGIQHRITMRGVGMMGARISSQFGLCAVWVAGNRFGLPNWNVRTSVVIGRMGVVAQAGAKLLACLAVEEENRLAIAVSRPKAIDPIVKMTRRDAIMPTQVESEDEMSIVLEAQEWACVALGYLCQVPKLHFLLLAAEVVPALVDVARDVDTATTNARLGALRGLAGLSTRSLQWEERAVGSVPVADEIQRSLMQQGVLAMAMFVVDSSPDMPLKIAAADICAGLADLVQGMGADREREVLALKMPLVNMKQTSPSQEARDAADKALGTLTALEGRLARSWVGNNFGQTVQPAPYAMGITAGAGTEDMDQLD
eukprot:gene8714-10336_t